MAARVINDAGIAMDSAVDRLYRIAFSRAPNAGERKAIAGFLGSQAAILRERIARNEIAARMAEIRSRTLKPLWADSALLVREDRDTR